MIGHIRLDLCRAGMEHIRMLYLQARRLGLKAWDQGQNRLVEHRDLKT